MDNVAKMVGLLFMSRTYAHMAHLNTKSFAKHKALNEFYEEIVDLADELAEAAQGKFGKLDIPYMDLKGDIGDPITGLKLHWTMVENLEKKCEYPWIGNIIQEIDALYSKTNYLMTELN